jgi:amidase
VALHKDNRNADPAVIEALDKAAAWLSEAGYIVEEASPPEFEAAADLWRTLVYNDVRRNAPYIMQHGDDAIRANMQFILDTTEPVSLDAYLDALARRHSLARAWSLFIERYPVALMPVSWNRPAPVDEDLKGDRRLEALIQAQSPLLATALLGLPGLSVPIGMAGGVPIGVQLVANRFREDLCLAAGETIERAAGFKGWSQ